MFLVAVAIIFLWTVQILLFEPNYTETTMETLYERVQQNVKELESIEGFDSSSSDNPVLFLSKTIVGMSFLIDENGNVTHAYNNGQEVNLNNLEHDYSWILDYSTDVINGQSIKKVQDFSRTTAILIGVPTTLEGKKAGVLLYNTITQIDALQSLNRKQLLLFSLLLSVVASIIAFFLARQFIKPIDRIKNAVTDLTKGELEASPNLHRKDELGVLSNTVDELGKELQRLDVLRKEVIANVSHELRSPLSLIKGYSEMVRDVTGNDEEQRKNNMDVIINETDRLNQMVDDIMDYSMMQAGYSELKLELCNLYDLIQSTVEYGRGIAYQYDIQIEYVSFSKSINVELDTLKINQVLRNLLNNAINHTKNGETIRVLIQKKDTTISVTIANPGEDIPQEQLEQIWERYQRIQHQGGRHEGTGIGLAIVSTILSAHNMEFGAESANGRTSFWFVINSY